MTSAVATFRTRVDELAREARRRGEAVPRTSLVPVAPGVKKRPKEGR